MKPHPNAATDSLDADGIEAGASPAPHRMTTDRFVLRRAHSDEVEFDRLHALFADVDDSEEVFELCGWDAHESDADTRAYLDRKAEQWERGEAYEYLLETVADGELADSGTADSESADREPVDSGTGEREPADSEPVDSRTNESELVGTAILEVSEDDDSGEFGIWLRKPYWGRGFSGEATGALVHVAFQCLDAPFVVIGCRPENERSRRAIEKIVRRYDGAYFGSPPIVSNPSRNDEGDVGEERGNIGVEQGNVVVPHHEWVITAEQFASEERGLSTLVPGVEYDDIDF